MTAQDARRAGRALFEVTHPRGEARPTLDALTSFEALLVEHPPLREALLSPFVPGDRKRAIVDQVTALEPMPVAARQLLGVLAEQQQFTGLSPLTREFRILVHRQERRVDAVVTTAVPLSEAQVAHLRDVLAQATQQQVSLASRVDPGIIGGAITRVGSVVYDGSLARQLARLKEQIQQG
jgi:F-type H+-transporting ATPase subunit delta